MLKTKKRLDELEANMEHLIERQDKLRDDFVTLMESDLRVEVARALADVLDKNQGLTIRHYLNDKEITTKLVKDELKELKQQQSDLEWTLKQVKETIKKYGK